MDGLRLLHESAVFLQVLDDLLVRLLYMLPLEVRHLLREAAGCVHRTHPLGLRLVLRNDAFAAAYTYASTSEYCMVSCSIIASNS